MLLVYVENILAVSEVAEELVGVIGSKFKLKKSSVGRPSRYLGGGIEQVQTDDGRIIWSANCIEALGCCLASGKLGFDPVRPDDVLSPLDCALISKIDWAEFYPDADEQLPRRMPTPHGAEVLTRAYVDANHAGNLANRRSHTGILIYINNSPVLWYSKKQNTVETSSFGSEFVALHIAVEMVEALRYKLRCFGVPIDGPTEVLCDNRSVVTNSSVLASTPNKRHNAI
ncbi:hypothetical protein CTEN210_05476 [Chaetoceros tenuissimus]|uniref:Uncharacterized protein n=1 Tax=Chaetoceros tenuissimus TaxID=426638 RepID=A0AAD3CPX3_9STRA|nr:hypothetical protein CTEN210_05476 [Chaetoceros tenuissimus]